MINFLIPYMMFQEIMMIFFFFQHFSVSCHVRCMRNYGEFFLFKQISVLLFDA